MAKKRSPAVQKKSAARGAAEAKAAKARKNSPAAAIQPVAQPLSAGSGIAALIRGSLTLPRPGANPLPAGTAGTEVPIPPAPFQQLIAAAAVQDNKGSQVWVKGGSELLVLTSKVTASLDDGLVLISIPVSCDQAVNATIQVPFAVGGKDTPAGMICATEDRPRGPAAVVDVWSDSLIAFAWRILLTVATQVAAQSGVDQDGAVLIPVSLTATKTGLALLPIARHTFDRVTR